LHIPVVDLGQSIEVCAGVVGLMILPSGEGHLRDLQVLNACSIIYFRYYLKSKTNLFSIHEDIVIHTDICYASSLDQSAPRRCQWLMIGDLLRPLTSLSALHLLVKKICYFS
jgi:hypothetical protein